MATVDQLKKRVDNALARHAKVTEKKAKLRGQLDARKTELIEIGAEIEAAGFDPRKLRDQRDQAHEDLNTLLESFERDLEEVEAALDAFGKEDV